MDADITTEILRSIRDELRSTRDELKAEMAEFRTEMKRELTELRTDLGVTNMRLEGVERVLVGVAQEQRMLTQFVKRLATRVDKLEERGGP